MKEELMKNWKSLTLGLVLILLFSYCAKEEQEEHKEQKMLWPTEGWTVSTPEEQGVDGALLSELDSKFASGDYGYIDGFLIVRNGYLVYEKSYEHDYAKIRAEFGNNPILDRQDNLEFNYYHPDYHPYYQGTKLHTLQSATKSIASTVIGIAIGHNEIPDVEVKVLNYFEDYEVANVDERKKSMTLEDLLTMRPGFEWYENLPLEDPNNSVTQLENADDWIDFTINHPMEFDPGTVFEYCSGASQLLAFITKQSTGMHADEYAEKYLFQPLGIDQYHWKKTPKGYPDTLGGLYLEARDLAKIGYLFLNDGVWEGDRMLPEGWAQAAVHPHVADVAPDNDKNNTAYGYQWWLLPLGDQSHEYVFAAMGFGGQYLMVSPKFNLIAVFYGWNIYDIPRLPELKVVSEYLSKIVKTDEAE
jgi:CubicO group peptidase (beta-lactamase class C family)